MLRKRMAPRFTASSSLDIQLRDVVKDDLPIFFVHQCDPAANEMAAVPARERDAFMAHWARILADNAMSAMTIVVNGDVAGNILSWEQGPKRLVGYWIGQEYWGRNIATLALSKYLRIVPDRPLRALVAKSNAASIRVLEKCGFTMCVEETRSLVEPADGVEEWVFRLDACDSVRNCSKAAT